MTEHLNDKFVDKKGSDKVRAILIGVSTGGPKALLRMLPDLSEKVSIPIIIVQHMPAGFINSLAKSIDIKCRHTAVECENEGIIENGYIYLAPAGKHLELQMDNKGRVVAFLTGSPPENGCRPSVDVLFRSASGVYGNDSIAIVLTGMVKDGTNGLVFIENAGAYTIAQDEESRVVWGMPGSAVNAGLVVDKVASIESIPDVVSVLV